MMRKMHKLFRSTRNYFYSKEALSDPTQEIKSIWLMCKDPEKDVVADIWGEPFAIVKGSSATLGTIKSVRIGTVKLIRVGDQRLVHTEFDTRDNEGEQFKKHLAECGVHGKIYNEYGDNGTYHCRFRVTKG